MKKFVSILMLLCIGFSMFTLSACDDKPKTGNLYQDFEKFDSYVDTNSDIIGIWKMVSPDTDKEWQFFASTTLHQTKYIDDISTSTICTFNYNDETGELKVFAFTGEIETAYTVEINGDDMTVTTAEGEKLVFERVKK